MPKSISENLAREGRNLQPGPIIWRLVINTGVGQATALRITNNNTPVIYEGREYTPFPFTVGAINSTAEGSLTTFPISISNASLELVGELDARQGLIGNGITLGLVSQTDLDASEPASSLDVIAEIVNTEVDEETITFTVGHFNLKRLTFPSERFMAVSCRYLDFGGPECGYNITTGAFSECARTLSDCTERGDDEESNNLTREHPRRFGGFRGLS